MNYTVSRASNRAGQQDLFTSRSGIKVFANPAAFPRAWTVHHLLTAPDEDRGAGLVRDGAFDLRDTAVLAGAAPSLDRCESPDRVTWIDRRPSTVALRAQMGCKGMLVVGDNWYPGWHAQVDGKPVPIWRVNTVIRGIVLEKGSHQIVMRYRPASVYVGLICWALGLAVAVCLQYRREAPELDLMKQPRSTP
ncbi:MAG TPA: YfhO family protein [Bryobacteraceae bacterium]|nr:YfhO family protein [Bryobacteraceae bacterium]